MTVTPKYLTGNQAAITEFIDKFDVSDLVADSDVFLHCSHE